MNTTINEITMEEREYTIAWVAYENGNVPSGKWDEIFNTRKQAIQYLKDLNIIEFGRVECEASVCCDNRDDYYLSTYGATKSEAIKKLKKECAVYGIKPIDPYEN